MAAISKSHIADLRSILPDIQIVTPDSSEYAQSISHWNVRAERNAGAIVFPTTSLEASQILRFSDTHLLDIAIKAGGHGNRGSSPNNGGLCIDLSKMNSVSVDPIKKQITAGGGTLWSHVYAEAEKYDLAAVGGISPNVGVGGLTLHGGYGWLTSAHGLATDNVIEMEIVLADGSIVQASNTANKDLFWAMKGAGCMFGMVTAFLLQGYEQKEWVWSGHLILEKDSLRPLLQVCKMILARESKGEAALCWGWNALPGIEPGIWALPWYNGSEQKAREFFAPLLDLKPLVDRTKMVPFSASGTLSGSAAGRDLRKIGHGSSVMAPPDPVFFESLFADFAAFIAEVPDARKSIVGFEVYNPYPTMQVGQKETAYPNRGHQINVQAVPTWTDKKNDNICIDWCLRFSAKIANEFEGRKKEVNVDDITKTSVGIYSNYDGKQLAAISISARLRGIGFNFSPKKLFGINYARLINLKKKYDPHNLFRSFIDLHAIE